MPMWGIELTNVETALQHKPNLPVYFSRPSWIGVLMGWVNPWIDGRLLPGFRKTMAPVDSRLAEMEIGLGVVTESIQRFYPLSTIRQRLEDTLDGRAIRLSIGPDSIPRQFGMTTKRGRRNYFPAGTGSLLRIRNVKFTEAKLCDSATKGS